MSTSYPSDDGTSTTSASNALVSTGDASGVALEDETPRSDEGFVLPIVDSSEAVIESALKEHSNGETFVADDWKNLPLDESHARELFDSAVTPSAAFEVGVRTIRTAQDLPASVSWLHKFPEALPAWCVEYDEADGPRSVQIKPAAPVAFDKRAMKYVSGSDGAAPRLPMLRVVENSKHAVLVEGTKQSMSVLSHVEDSYSVYGLAGIHGWSRDGVPCKALQEGRFEGVDVIVVPDADAATNLAVYEGAKALGEALKMDGANSVTFVSLDAAGASGKAGIDDYLAAVPADRRADRLVKLFKAAKSKPAARVPKAKAAKVVAGADRPLVDVTGDRGPLMHEIIGILQDRIGGVELFSSGYELVKVEGSGSTLRRLPVAQKHLIRMITDHMTCIARSGRDGSVTYKHPDSATLQALETFYSEFPVLKGISTTPLVRPDGSIACVSGYDAALEFYLVLDESLAGLVVPEHPSADEILDARRVLIDLLDDFAFRNEGDRDAAVALLMTALTRPLYEKSPLFLLNGLQPGVGKGLLADIIVRLVAGREAPVMKWPSNDDELRKQLTSSLIAGQTFLSLDEIKDLESAVMNAFVTASVWSDRKLGESSQLLLPNRSVIVGTGNNVAVPGDMARRVLNIRLEWLDGSPEMRKDFKYANITKFVEDNRPELLVAALTLVRAYFDRGCPEFDTDVRYGSFEEWQRIVGGIMDVAGFDQFLSNVVGDRTANNTEEVAWADFLGWCHDEFGDASFTCNEVTTRLIAQKDAPWPPEFDLQKTSAVALGLMFRRELNRPRRNYRVVDGGMMKKTRLWMVEDMSSASVPSSSSATLAPAPSSSVAPVDDLSGLFDVRPSGTVTTFDLDGDAS